MKYIDRRCDFGVINYNEWIAFVGLRWPTETARRKIPFPPLKCDFEKFPHDETTKRTGSIRNGFPWRGKLIFRSALNECENGADDLLFVFFVTPLPPRRFGDDDIGGLCVG